MDLLQERQKLILLADKSQYGWKTVLEYKHHHLADDKEDEKKIYMAESRAARSTKRFTSRSIRQRNNVTSTSTPAQLSASQLSNLFSRVNPQLSLRDQHLVCALLVANPGIGRLSVLICGLMFLLIPVRIPYDPLRTSIWNKTLFMRIATN